MLAANPAAMQGLTAVMRAGRRNGLNTATFAGVTLTVHSPLGAEKAQVRSKKGSNGNGRPKAPATGSRAPNSRRRGRKSAAQQKKDAARYAAKRMTHKFLPVMHLVSKFVHEQQQQQLLSVDVEELPQIREPPSRNSRHFTGGAGGAASHCNLLATRKWSTRLQHSHDGWLQARHFEPESSHSAGWLARRAAAKAVQQQPTTGAACNWRLLWARPAWLTRS